MSRFEAVCAREAAGDQRHGVVNQRRRCFMDVGYWGGGGTSPRTDFGLICGRFVLLCSWINVEQRIFRTNPNLPRKVLNIINANHNRGFVRVQHQFHRPLIPEDTVYLIIPDLHLNLFKQSTVDNFVYGYAAPPRSLELELDQLLSLGESQNANTVQIGDCFEMWEAQAHLIHRYEEVHYILNEQRDRLRPQTRATLEAISTQRRIPVEDQGREGRIVLARDRMTIHMDQAVERYGWTPDDVGRFGVPFQDRDAVKQRIMARYPSIFSGARYGDRMRFLLIQGNHDNMLANNFYGRGRLPAANWIPPQNTTFDDIHFEHGHYYDVYNNNRIFDDESKGYDMTHRYTLDSTLGERGIWNGALLRWVGDIAYNMRPPQLRRTAQIFSANESVRVVVMGHTHSPTLFDFDTYLSCVQREERARAREGEVLLERFREAF